MRLHAVTLAALLLVFVPRANSCVISCGLTSDVSPNAVLHVQVDGRSLLSAHVTITAGRDTLFSGTPSADGTINLRNLPLGLVLAELDLWGLQNSLCFKVAANANAIHDLNLVPEFGLFGGAQRNQIVKGPIIALLYSYPDGTLPSFQDNDGKFLAREGIRFTLQDAFNGATYEAVSDPAGQLRLDAPTGAYVLRIAVGNLKTKFSFFVRLVDPNPPAQSASEKPQLAEVVIYMRYRNLGDCGDLLDFALNPKQLSGS